jgi:hypothetical protein
MTNDEFIIEMKGKCPNLLKKDIYLECGIGWQKLLKNLMLTIEEEILRIQRQDLSLAEEIYTVQIKQKFGGLRFYMSSSTTFIDGAIRLAERMSESTCETCGSTDGFQTGKYWIRVSCDKCLHFEGFLTGDR